MESRNKALSHLRKSLRAGRGEELPMQKVSVIAPDKKGLEEGLKKAEELLPKISKMSSEMEDEMESPMHESKESEDYESGEEEAESEMSMEKPLEECSREELIEMVKKLKESKED